MPPRKKVKRCPTRAAGPELTTTVEWFLHWGEDASGIGPLTIEDQRRAWATHKERFMAHWKEHCPGSRPGAWHMFNECPPIQDSEIGGWGELEVLRQIGEVDDAEAARAADRIRTNEYRREVPPLAKVF